MEFIKPNELILDPNTDTLYVIDKNTASIIAVDAVTGDRVLVSGFPF